MLVGLRLANVQELLDETSKQYAYYCRRCATYQHVERTRCALCGDRRHRIVHRFRRVRVASTETTAEALQIPLNRSFLKAKEGDIRELALQHRERVREALADISIRFAPGSQAYQIDAKISNRIHHKANRLLASIPRQTR